MGLENRTPHVAKIIKPKRNQTTVQCSTELYQCLGKFLKITTPKQCFGTVGKVAFGKHRAPKTKTHDETRESMERNYSILRLGVLFVLFGWIHQLCRVLTEYNERNHVFTHCVV
jgi:hypothetical protein